MISRALLWMIGLSVVGLILLSWWGGTRPTRIVIINQAGKLREVAVESGGRRFEIGEISRGASARVSVPPGPIVLTYHGSEPRSWNGQAAAGQSLVLTIRPNERVDSR